MSGNVVRADLAEQAEPAELAKLVLQAHHRISSHVRRSWLEYSPVFSAATGANVYFKLENLQHTGSFKLRGAMNKFLSMEPGQQEPGMVAASTGNHGRAVAYTAKKLSGRATVFVPDNADAGKIQAIRCLDADVRVAGQDCVEAELAAREFASKNGAVYVSPYNDPLVAAGQGTIGVELLEQLPDVDAVFASLGGGGLISGIGGYMKSRLPNCQIVGCSPGNSSVMIDSLKAGELLDLPSQETISDGTAGGVEQGSVTFGWCQQFVDHCVTVSEAEICDQLRRFIETHNMLIEGAAAVAIAGLIQARDSYVGKNVVVVLCGANISIKKLEKAIRTSHSVSS